MNITTSSIRSFATSILALSIGVTGCSGTAEGDAYDITPDDLGALSSPASVNCYPDPDEIIFERTTTGTNTYYFYQRATLDASISTVWNELKNFENLVDIAIAGASNFQWINGGSPWTVPSSFQFVYSGTTLKEKIFYRNSSSHVAKYELLMPALGIEEYVGIFDLDPGASGTTIIEYERYMELQPGTSVDDLSEILAQEIIDIKAYYESN